MAFTSVAAEEYMKGGAAHCLIPASVALIRDLDWRRDPMEGEALTGDMIYKPEIVVEGGSGLRVIAAHQCAYFKGQPRAIFVFDCPDSDARTQDLCARRAESLMMQMEEKSLSAHSVRSVHGGAAVLSADWSSRAQITQYLPDLLDSDPQFNLMVFKGAMSKDRRAYDEAVLKSFIGHDSGMDRHLGWPSSMSNRFADFTCKDTVHFGIGVRFDLVFDDPELSRVAMACLKRIKKAIDKSFPGLQGGWRFPFQVSTWDRNITDDDFQNTQLILSRPCLTLKARWNGFRTRALMALFLCSLCGLRPGRELLSAFNLFEQDLIG